MTFVLVHRQYACARGGTTRAWEVTRSLDKPCPQIAAHGLGGSAVEQCGLEDDGHPDPLIAPSMLDKPRYLIPTMDDVRAVPWNGLRVASLFCGAGGSSTGYRMAGYRVLAACEFVPAAQASYAANKADYTVLLREDVRALEAQTSCSTPAASVSASSTSSTGRRRASRSRRQDSATDPGARCASTAGSASAPTIFSIEYARLVDGVRPKVFVAENVTGLVKGRAKGYFKRIMAALRACGYKVEARTLDASWLGVPQARRRVIIVGVRDDLGVAPALADAAAVPVHGARGHRRPARHARRVGGDHRPRGALGRAAHDHRRARSHRVRARHGRGATQRHLHRAGHDVARL
jgi:site-specific DNA-cytosine methylase